MGYTLMICLGCCMVINAIFADHSFLWRLCVGMGIFFIIDSMIEKIKDKSK